MTYTVWERKARALKRMVMESLMRGELQERHDLKREWMAYRSYKTVSQSPTKKGSWQVTLLLTSTARCLWFPGLQTPWYSQHYLGDIKVVVGGYHKLWEIQLRYFISFSEHALSHSPSCGGSFMSGPAGRVSPAQKWDSHRAECAGLDMFISSQACLENTMFQSEKFWR